MNEHEHGQPTQSFRPATPQPLSPEEAGHLEASGLSRTEIHRLLFLRWLHTRARLHS